MVESSKATSYLRLCDVHKVKVSDSTQVIITLHQLVLNTERIFPKDWMTHTSSSIPHEMETGLTPNISIPMVVH